MTELLPKPIPPEDWECCGSECGDYCVYEIYRREKQAYDEQQSTLKKIHCKEELESSNLDISQL